MPGILPPLKRGLTLLDSGGSVSHALPPPGPQTFQRMDMHCAQAVAVCIAGSFTLARVNSFVGISPRLEPTLAVVCVGVDTHTRATGGLEQRLNRCLYNMRCNTAHDRAPPLAHAQNRRFFLRQGAPAPRALQATPTALSLLGADAGRMALVPRHSKDCGTCDCAALKEA
jgi:hypothetical protein